MNFTPLMASSSVFAQYEPTDPIADFYGIAPSLVDVPNSADFLPEVFEYQEEAFNMHTLLMGDDLTGGVSPNPSFPNVINLDMFAPLNQLRMLTNNLYEYAAPEELCIQKALELINSRSNYALNIEAFRMELLADVIGLQGSLDVNALVAGVKCVADHLLEKFDYHLESNADFFPYEFYCLHSGRYLFLTKIVLDANLSSPVRPATIIQPAYTYPEVQARVRADYITEADQCVVL